MERDHVLLYVMGKSKNDVYMKIEKDKMRLNLKTKGE